MAIGVIAFFMFILIVPGLFVDVIKKGSKESTMFPSFNLVNSIYDSIRVWILRIVYMLVPAFVFFIVLSTLGPAGISFIQELKIHTFIATFGMIFLVILVTYLIFEFLFFFAKARFAYFDSLSEALKVHEVIRDIQNIGMVNIVKWLIVMFILMVAISWVSSLVLVIPYVGFLIYICVVIPIMESISNYSLGMLYSNIDRY